MGPRVLIIGLGSIGKRHARLIQQHFPYEIVALRSRLGQEPSELPIAEVRSWEEVDEQSFDVAVIANPTCMHIETAIRCAERGMHLFIEKPIDCGTAELDDLLRIVGERGLSTYVAYPLRFHPVVRSLKARLERHRVLHASMVSASYLPDWRPNQEHGSLYSGFREKGGGVLLDMSHELDTAEHLFGPVRELRGKLSRLSGLTSDSDDCADLIAVHDSSVTSIHLNYFGKQPRRYVEVDTAEGSLRADLIDPVVVEARGGEASSESFEVERDFMYLEQLRYFFDNLGRTDMTNNLMQASGLFRKMIEFREGQGYGSADNHLRAGRVAGG